MLSSGSVKRQMAARIRKLDAQIRDLVEEREELLTEIRRPRMGDHPVGRALGADNAYTYVTALAEALTEGDAEHEGGEGA